MDFTDKDGRITRTDLNFKMPLLMMAILFVGYMLLNKDNQPERAGNTEKRIESLISSKKLMIDPKAYNNQPFDANRASAISSIKCNEYKNTIQNIAKIENRTNQDYFYQAYAYLKNGQSKKASENFAQAVSLSNESESLLNSAKIFQVISTIKTGELQEARKLYENLDEDSWPKRRLKAIMDTLKD